MAKDASELRFEDYLRFVGFDEGDFEYEPFAGTEGVPTPDYRLNPTKPPTLFEVKSHTAETRQAEAIMEQAQRNTQRMEEGLPFEPAMSLDPYIEIRSKIGDAKRQFRPYKYEYPCVLVLDNTNGILVDFFFPTFAAALFGDMTLVTPAGNMSGGYWTFGRNGVLQPKHNRTFSAVCGIETIRPDAKKAAATVAKVTRGKSPADFGEWARIHDEIIAKEGLDISRTAPKMTVILNPFARIGVDASIFSGPYDEVWWVKGDHFERM